MGLTYIDVRNELQRQTPALTLYRFVGVSTDAKPTILSDGTALPAGATFDERDTGYTFRFDGKAWQVLSASKPNVPGGLAPDLAGPVLEIRDLLTEIRDLLVDVIHS